MGLYASDTTVSSDRTRSEIERTLMKYGASGFMYGWSGTAAMVAFEMNHRRIRFDVPLPAEEDFRFTPSTRVMRNDAQTRKEWEQGCRQRWRALALVIKAKLEAVECGITSFESEFLANIVLPNNQTFGQWALPHVANAYENAQMPPMLPDLRGD